MDTRLTLSLLPEHMAICRLSANAPLPDRVLAGEFFSVTRTADELSIVCPEADVPAGATVEAGWRCLKVHGPLDFSMTGVMASLAAPLAAAGVSMFVFSTYDTDYLMVKAGSLDRAVAALQTAGHRIQLSHG